MPSPDTSSDSSHYESKLTDKLGRVLGDSSQSQVSNDKQHLTKELPTGPDIPRCDVSLGEARYVLRPEACDCVSDIEFALGLPEGALKEDPRNKINLEEDQFSAYVRGDWALLPDLTTLNDAVIFSCLDMVSPKRTIYDKVRPSAYVFERNLRVQCDTLQNKSQINNSTDDRALITAGPLIRSHVHPCYVVCDTAKKFHAQKYEVSDAAVLRRLGLCGGLYSRWLDARRPLNIIPPCWPIDENDRHANGRLSVKDYGGWAVGSPTMEDYDEIMKTQITYNKP
ncbi:hypothetical protein RhiJN_25400 [Ceratobasidium sp. AG-Ba]|nr:hypothetical protein RhiJN_25400 [Ceratobasidium sp. AG-Ba]